MIFEGFVDASRDGGVNQRNVTHLSTTGLCDASSHEHAIAIVTMIANTMHDSTASVSTKRCIPAQTDVEENIWYPVRFEGNHHCLYMIATPNQVPAGTTVTIHARATKGKMMVFYDTRFDVRESLQPPMVLETARDSTDFEIETKMQISVASKMYIGVELVTPDSSCFIKYTFDECLPTRSKLARDHWVTAPIQGGQRHCFYIFEPLEEVKEGTIVTIRARIAKGQATLFAGTQSNVRQQFRYTSRLVEYYGSRSGYFQFTASASSKVYVGFQLDSPDAMFQVKYTTGKQTTGKQTTGKQTTGKQTTGNFLR